MLHRHYEEHLKETQTLTKSETEGEKKKKSIENQDLNVNAIS